jgi:hypothetical protein
MAVAGSAFTDKTLGWEIRRDGTEEPNRLAEREFTPGQQRGRGDRLACVQALS